MKLKYLLFALKIVGSLSEKKLMGCTAFKFQGQICLISAQIWSCLPFKIDIFSQIRQLFSKNAKKCEFHNPKILIFKHLNVGKNRIYKEPNFVPSKQSTFQGGRSAAKVMSLLYA